jgi:hypothetical protein
MVCQAATPLILATIATNPIRIRDTSETRRGQIGGHQRWVKTARQTGETMMTQISEQFFIVDEWPAPHYWRRDVTHLPLSKGAKVRRLGLLARGLAVILAADARFRERQHLSRMCERMRRDAGLPIKGQDAGLHERLLLEGRDTVALQRPRAA